MAISEEDNKYNQEILDGQIIEQFDNFIEYGGFDFLIKRPVILRLNDVGLLNELPPIKESPLALAGAILISSWSVSHHDRKLMKEKGKDHPKIQSTAKVVGDLLIIKQVFQKLKDEKKHINDYLNK